MKTLHAIHAGTPTSLEPNRQYTTEATHVERIGPSQFRVTYRLERTGETYELIAICGWDDWTLQMFQRDLDTRGFTNLFWPGLTLMQGTYP